MEEERGWPPLDQRGVCRAPVAGPAGGPVGTRKPVCRSHPTGPADPKVPSCHGPRTGPTSRPADDMPRARCTAPALPSAAAVDPRPPLGAGSGGTEHEAASLPSLDQVVAPTGAVACLPPRSPVLLEGAGVGSRGWVGPLARGAPLLRPWVTHASSAATTRRWASMAAIPRTCMSLRLVLARSPSAPAPSNASVNNRGSDRCSSHRASSTSSTAMSITPCNWGPRSWARAPLPAPTPLPAASSLPMSAPVLCRRASRRRVGLLTEHTDAARPSRCMMPRACSTTCRKGDAQEGRRNSLGAWVGRGRGEGAGDGGWVWVWVGAMGCECLHWAWTSPPPPPRQRPQRPKAQLTLFSDAPIPTSRWWSWSQMYGLRHGAEIHYQGFGGVRARKSARGRTRARTSGRVTVAAVDVLSGPASRRKTNSPSLPQAWTPTQIHSITAQGETTAL